MAATTGRRFTINQIVAQAYRKAGLMNEHEELGERRASVGRTELEAILNFLEAQGVFARFVKLTLMDITAGTPNYQVTSDVIDVIGDGSYLQPGQADWDKTNGDILIQQLPRNDYMNLSAKGATGVPTQMFPDKSTDPLTIWLWPVPSVTTKIRIQAQQKTQDANDGNASLDLEEYWLGYVKLELAHQIGVSSSLPIDRLAYLSKEADKYLRVSKGKAQQRPGVLAYLAHEAPSGRRR